MYAPIFSNVLSYEASLWIFHNPNFKCHRSCHFCNMLRFRKVIDLASLFFPENVMLY